MKIVELTNMSLFSLLKEGDLAFLRRRICFWDSPEMCSGKHIAPDQYLIYLGTAIGYVGDQLEVVESQAWLVDGNVWFSRAELNTFVAIWPEKRVKEIEEKLGCSLNGSTEIS